MKTEQTHTPNPLESESYLSHCCGSTVHLGDSLIGCNANWVCDSCGCMCHTIRRDAAPDLLKALEAVVSDLDLLSNLPGGSSELQFMVDAVLAKAVQP